MRRTVPVAVAVVCGLIALVDFFVSEPTVDALGAGLAEGVIILAGFALLWGILNILRVHSRRAVSGEQDRSLSLLLVVALLVTLFIGVVGPGTAPLEWIFDYMLVPLQSTMTALLAFFIVSAAYRAFRIRTFEAAILFTTSILFLVIQLPFIGGVVPYLAEVREWLLAIPVTAGVRGMLLGIALGTMSTALRILLAVDQPYASS